jgi:POT family proton-dependent oligopeptide transporter
LNTTDTREKLSLLDSLKILFSASRGFWMVNIVNFGDGIAYFGMLALMTLFLEKEVGFTTSLSTMGVSAFTGGVTIFMALGGGVVSDRLGVRRALTLCLGMILVGRVLFALAPGMGMVAASVWISILIMAMGEGVIQPALYSGIKEYTDSRTQTMGFAILYAIMNLGIFAGEMVSPLIREYWAEVVEGRTVQEDPTAGIAGAFWFFIAMTAVMLVVNLLFFTRRVEERDRTVLPEQKKETEPETGWFERLKNLPILDRRFQFFIFILLPVRTLFAHQWLTMPHYVTRAFPSEIGAKWEWLNGLNPLIIVVFVPLIAGLTQKRKVVDMMIIGTAISALSSFLLLTGPNLKMLILYFVIFSIGESFWSSRFLEYVADLAPVNKVGVYMGIATIPWFLAKFITGFYSGYMLDRFVPVSGPQSPGTLWLIYGLIALISPIGLILARKWLLAQRRDSVL